MTPALTNIVRSSYKDQLLGKFTRLLVLWVRSRPQPEKKSYQAEKGRTGETGKESIRRAINLYGGSRGLFDDKPRITARKSS